MARTKRLVMPQQGFARQIQITDGILRTIIIKRDPRHVASIKAQKAQKAEEKNIDVEAIAAEAVEAAAAESAE